MTMFATASAPAPHSATFAPPGVATCDVGLIGLAVMGQNLALNLADHGYKVAVFNRTTTVTEQFIADNPPSVFGGGGGRVVPCATETDLIKALKQPRIVIVLVKAGPAVDAVTKGLVDSGIGRDDIVVDTGNSLWTDTIRREKDYAGKLTFFGSGDRKAWQRLKPIWEAIAAKVDPTTGKPIEGATPGHPIVAPGAEPCTTYIGPDGAGHYVKMVHNGIEYGDMQLISEAYFLMKHLLKLKPDQMADIFATWNQGDLDSFLIEITADILRQRDPASPRSKKFLVDQVLDAAGQKGTGKWTSVNALDMGVPAPTIAEAVFARCMSAIKAERVVASKLLKGPKTAYKSGKAKLIDAIRDALYCSKICSYAQGFALMAEAQKEHGWKLDFGAIAMIWRGGCIIRARFLQKIKEAYGRNPALPNLLLDPYFRNKIARSQANWRKVVALAAEAGVACPTFMSALSYYDSYRTAVLPANLLQAQRDYFGAHTFERLDQQRGRFFHVDWPDPARPQSPVS
jgi:6-phosphogluconate dehydrogenase